MNLVSTVFEISFSPEFERGAIRVRTTRGHDAGRVGMAGDEEPTPDVSRRDALKKIGIGAGIAWSAPVVLSFYNAAGAATGTPDNSTTTVGRHLPPPLRSAPARPATTYDPVQFDAIPTGLHLCLDARPVCVVLRAGSNAVRRRSAVRARLQLPAGILLRDRHLLPLQRSLQRVRAVHDRGGLPP